MPSLECPKNTWAVYFKWPQIGSYPLKQNQKQAFPDGKHFHLGLRVHENQFWGSVNNVHRVKENHTSKETNRVRPRQISKSWIIVHSFHIQCILIIRHCSKGKDVTVSKKDKYLCPYEAHGGKQTTKNKCKVQVNYKVYWWLQMLKKK